VSFILKLIPGGKTARLALGVALLAGIFWVVHWGYNLYRTTNSVTVSPATVGLALNSPDDEEVYSALTLTSMQPGANAYVGVTVANTGTSDFYFAMSSTVSGDGALDSDARIGVAAVAAGSCTSSGYASGTSLHRDARGLSAASVGGQPLAAGDSEYLCFHIQLPLAVPKSIQGRSAQDTLDFTAQQ
jgi:hypothetical protein